MKSLKKIISISIALIMLAGLLPLTALADTNYRAYVRFANGTFKEYATFPAAWSEATASSGNTVGLYNNWESGRFCVPEKITVTLEMNGYWISRNLSSSKGDGEVFWVGPNATLNVYGGTKADPAYNSTAEHNMWVYVADSSRYDYTRRKVLLHGGIINGGNSDNGGGGIHMKEGAHVNLYYVTVAGNKADNWGASYGDGGGVEMNNKNGCLYLDHSKIIYNAARYDGGGVHVDSEWCRIIMVKSHIDHNVADDNGAGIYVDGDNFSLRGDAEQIMDPESVVSAYSIPDWNGAYNFFLPDELGSSVSYNCVFDSEDGGGGIYLDNEKFHISGINFVGNIATNDDDKGNGGGLYLDEEESTIKNCNILRNKADCLGGGIYDRGDDRITDLDDNGVDSCTIWKNLAWESGGAGGGIFVNRYCDLNISGSLIVRDNVSKSYSNDNLYLSSDGGAVDAYLMPSLSKGADVHVRISTAGAAGHGTQISRDPGSYDESFYTFDNDSGKHISWEPDRYLRVVSGAKPVKPVPSVFTPDPGKRTQSLSQKYTVDGVDYPIIKGIVSYPSFPDDYADIENVFYYSDGFFAGSTLDYNPQLATLSMCLAGAAGYSNEYGKEDANGDYLDKSQNFRQFVSDIGCADTAIYVNDFNTQKPGADTIGVGIASKQIFGTKTLVVIGVRGMGYESEWISNMTLGASGEAAGWSSAATQVMAELNGYLSRMGIDGSSENTIFWIAGYSRAGATSNLTAKRIVDKYDTAGTHTFAYPLEAPMGGVESAKVAGNNYNCIHNVFNQNDIVPWTGTTEMGFIRYGVDHFIPGSVETHTPSDGSDNNLVPEDNTAWNVGNNGYNNQKMQMLAQLSAVNPDIFFDDYFHTATVRYLTSQFWGTTDAIIESSYYQDEMGTTEKFIDFFFEKLQEWAFKYDINGGVIDPALSPRQYFSSYEIDNHKSFQQAAASAAGLLFGKSSDEQGDLLDCFSSIPDRLGMWKLLCIYCNIDEDDIDNLKEDIGWIWDCLIDPDEDSKAKGYRSLKDYLPQEEIDELQACFKSLLFPLLCFAGEDYDDYGQDIVGTLAYNISRIIANHYPEVTHSWLRSYDYLYASDTYPVVMDPAVKTAPSPVAVEITHADGTIETVIPDGSIIWIEVDDVVRLIPSDADDVNAGEAIYYRFLDGAFPFSDRGVHAYSRPFYISEMLDTHSWNGSFLFEVTAAHNGIKLPAATVRLAIEGTAYMSIALEYENDEYVYGELPMSIGQSTTIGGVAPEIADNVCFKCWEVYGYDAETGTVGEAISADKYIEYFGTDFNANSETTTVANRKGVSARFVPIYEKIVSSIDMRFGGGRGIQDLDGMYYLPSYIEWNVGGDEPFRGPETIFWTFDSSRTLFIAEFSLTLTGYEKFEGIPQLVFDDYSLNPYIVNMDSNSINGTASEKRLIVTIAFYPYLPPEEFDYGSYMDDQCVVAYDLNLNQMIGEYHFHNEGTVTAPIIENMEFVHWANGSTDHTTEVTSIYMNAYYRPIVNAVEITLSEPLEAGELLPGMSGVKVTVSNVWRLDSGAALSWNSQDTTADYNKVYTARITITKAELTGTNLTFGGASVPLAGAFTFAPSPALTVKAANGKILPVTNSVFTVTDDMIYLDIVFERTDKLMITGFAEVGATVPHSSTQEQMLAALPAEVYAYLANGSMVSVPVEWTSVGSIDPSDPEAQTVTAAGNCTDDAYAVAEGASLTGTVTVLAAERTAAPNASPDSGAYTGVQTVSLTSEEDAVIYYAIVKAAKPETEPGAESGFIDPNTVAAPAAEDYAEYTDPIVINDYDEIVLIYAYAVKEGLRNSITVILQYDLTKPEVNFLETKDAMIAVDGNIECWYSTKTKCTGYDENGEPVFEDVPDRYYADEDCTVLLDYEEDVCVPAFIRSTFEVQPSDDLITACLDFEWQDTYKYKGFELIGVQAVGTDGDMRVIAVLDSRIIRDAVDYGYLFGAGDAGLTYDTASFRRSCKDTDNTLQSGDPGYQYVTARIPASFLDEGVYAGFYVTLENGVDIICTNSVLCSPVIEGSEPADNAEDNIVVDMLIMPGDVNCDGVVTMADVSALTAYIMNSGVLSVKGLANADANQDGVVDILDAPAIYMLAFGS
jgi:hypothetical protein